MDCTASSETGLRYPQLFKAGYSVVACNKIPFAGPYEAYASLKKAAVQAGVKLLHETTVGAALPILESLNRLVVSGDKLDGVEALLSGTLGWLCSHYEGHDFEALVEEARQKGYTEPNPALDLSGEDVRRKLVILAREAGIPLEGSEVDLEPFPSGKVLEQAYADATAAGKRLRYVARLTRDAATGWKASARLEAVGPESPLFGLSGTVNCCAITSADYPSPLVIQGGGAGARQTAGGVLNDILFI